MKKRIGALVTSLFVLGFSFLIVNNSSNGSEVIRDKKIIVELKDIDGTDINSRNEVEQAFKKQLQSVVGLNYRVTSNIKSVSNILFIDVNSEDVDKVSKLSLVDHVKESKTYNYEYENIVPYDSDNEEESYANDSAKTMNIDENSKNGENTFIAILDDSFEIDHEVFNELKNVNVRYSKEDIKNIISTSEFSAKKAGYKNNKVPFYYSYGTNNTDLTYLYNNTYHGQHVAGIAGGNSDSFKGISPNAQLALMKVTDSYGSFSSDEAILNALNDCSALDVDAINMSFGIGIIDFDFVDDLYQSVFDKLYDKGIAVNYSAGNDGRDYNYSPLNQNLLTSNSETSVLGGDLISDKTTSVASIYNFDYKYLSSSIATLSGASIKIEEQYAYFEDDDGERHSGDEPFCSLIPEGKDSVELEYIVVPNYGSANDYKNIDVKGKVAVIQRGVPDGEDEDNPDYSFTEKTRNAVKNGAIGVIIYNNEGATDRAGNSELTDIEKEYYAPCAYTDSYYGKVLINQEVKKIVISRELVSSFTSNGSTASLQLKPEIAAPGTSIYSSTYFNPNDGTSHYEYMSGTSMATPNYTGAFANILSNYDLINEENRISKRKELVARIMSSADPIKQANGAYYSPRLVGAGKVDASGAYNSNVYLLGNNENKAKIELKNNSDIKEGNVKFEVKTINESKENRTYKLRLTIQAPEITGVDVTFGEKFSNEKYQSSKDVLLREVSLGEVSVIPGESKFEVNASITKENKKYLDENFENGTYLEGYLILESLDNGEDLSIPYMGYYGDYDAEEPVEPFDFEKDENKVYGSDLLNYAIDAMGYNCADYSSMWVSLRNDLTSLQYTYVAKNYASFATFGTKVMYDRGNNEVILNQSGKNGKFVIQQFVNRSVLSNKVTMIDKSSGKNLLAPINDSEHVDHMFSLCMSDGSDSGKLYKSYVVSSLSSKGYYADRAYSVFDFSNKEQFPDGVEDGLYEFKFEYTLVDGSMFTKSYNLKVGETSFVNDTSIDSQTIKEIDGREYLYIRLSGSNLKELYVGDFACEIMKDENGYYSLFDISVFMTYGIKNKTFLVRLYDNYGNIKTALVYINNGLSVIKDGLVGYESINYKLQKYGSYKHGYLYTFTIIDSDYSTLPIDSEITITFDAFNGEPTKNMKIYSVGKNGLGDEIKYELVDGKITMKTTSGKFVILYDDSQDMSSLLILLIFVSSICGFVLIVVIGALLIGKRTRKLK